MILLVLHRLLTQRYNHWTAMEGSGGESTIVTAGVHTLVPRPAKTPEATRFETEEPLGPNLSLSVDPMIMPPQIRPATATMASVEQRDAR